MTNFQCKELGVQSDLIGIRFRSENFALMTNTPLSETKNLQIDIPHLIPKYHSQVLEQCLHFSSTQDKITFLQDFVLSTLREVHKTEDQLIVSVANEIRAASGKLKVRDLAKANYISLRQLERRFKNYIGLTIKQFSNIIRFNHAKQLIAQASDKSLSEIAWEVGFFDHAHMTKAFNRLSGENPTFFR